jgi:hypothetical protein
MASWWERVVDTPILPRGRVSFQATTLLKLKADMALALT